MQQYNDNIEIKAPNFFTIKLSVTLLILSFVAFQILFHLSTATLTSIATKQNIFTFEGLRNFTFDMWLLITLISVSLFCYAKLKKQTQIPLGVFFVLPILMLLISFVRNVSSIVVLALLVVITFLLCRFMYQNLSTNYLASIANANKTNQGHL